MTSRLLQNKIIIVNSEALETKRNKELTILTRFLMKNPTLIITSKNPDKNFLTAQKRVKHINHTPADVNIHI